MTVQHRRGKAHCNADGLSRILNLEPPCDCYDAGRNISDLPCGGCKYFQKIHNQWSKFGEDIDDVVPLAVREAGIELSSEDPNPDEIADACYLTSRVSGDQSSSDNNPIATIPDIPSPGLKSNSRER